MKSPALLFRDSATTLLGRDRIPNTILVRTYSRRRRKAAPLITLVLLAQATYGHCVVHKSKLLMYFIMLG